jgi:hypothetical protein
MIDDFRSFRERRRAAWTRQYVDGLERLRAGRSSVPALMRIPWYAQTVKEFGWRAGESSIVVLGYAGLSCNRRVAAHDSMLVIYGHETRREHGAALDDLMFVGVKLESRRLWHATYVGDLVRITGQVAVPFAESPHKDHARRLYERFVVSVGTRVDYYA